MKNEIETDVICMWTRVARAVEIAMLGGFTINVYIDEDCSVTDPYTNAKGDYELIKKFYSPVFTGFERDGLISLELCKPQMWATTAKRPRREPLSGLVERVEKAKLNPDPSAVLCTAGHALLKTATSKLNMSVKQSNDTQILARVIAKLEGCRSIQARHVAEAIHYCRALYDTAAPLEDEVPASVWAAMPTAQYGNFEPCYSADRGEAESFISDMRVVGVDYCLIELKPINK